MVKEAGESILDVLNIIHQKLHFLIQWKHPKVEDINMETLMNTPEDVRFEESIKEMDFTISINCLSLFRSITDYVNDLPLSALNLILAEKGKRD